MHYAGVKETKREFTIHDIAFSAFLWLAIECRLLNTKLYVEKNVYQLKTNYFKPIQGHVKKQGWFNVRLFQPHSDLFLDYFSPYLLITWVFMSCLQHFSLLAKNKRTSHCTMLDIDAHRPP